MVGMFQLLEITHHPANKQSEFFLAESIAERGHCVVVTVELSVAGVLEEVAQPIGSGVTGQSRSSSTLAENRFFTAWLVAVTVGAFTFKLADGELA